MRPSLRIDMGKYSFKSYCVEWNYSLRADTPPADSGFLHHLRNKVLYVA
jgi:hypothetical protein